MNDSDVSGRKDTRTAAAELFSQRPPVFVEVRFPKMGTAPDWHLLEDDVEFEALLDSLTPSVELWLTSVWDLKVAAGSVCVVKK
jgi:hypothetical protein